MAVSLSGCSPYATHLPTTTSRLGRLNMSRMRHLPYMLPLHVNFDPLEVVGLGLRKSGYGLVLDLLMNRSPSRSSELSTLYICWNTGVLHRQSLDGRVVIVLWDSDIGLAISIWGFPSSFATEWLPSNLPNNNFFLTANSKLLRMMTANWHRVLGLGSSKERLTNP